MAIPASEFGEHGQEFRHKPVSEADLNTETRFSDSPNFGLGKDSTLDNGSKTDSDTD